MDENAHNKETILTTQNHQPWEVPRAAAQATNHAQGTSVAHWTLSLSIISRGIGRHQAPNPKAFQTSRLQSRFPCASWFGNPSTRLNTFRPAGNQWWHLSVGLVVAPNQAENGISSKKKTLIHLSSFPRFPSWAWKSTSFWTLWVWNHRQFRFAVIKGFRLGSLVKGTNMPLKSKKHRESWKKDWLKIDLEPLPEECVQNASPAAAKSRATFLASNIPCDGTWKTTKAHSLYVLPGRHKINKSF